MIRPCGWLVSFPHSPATVQINSQLSESSVFNQVGFIALMLRYTTSVCKVRFCKIIIIIKINVHDIYALEVILYFYS